MLALTPTHPDNTAIAFFSPSLEERPFYCVDSQPSIRSCVSLDCSRGNPSPGRPLLHHLVHHGGCAFGGSSVPHVLGCDGVRTNGVKRGSGKFRYAAPQGRCPKLGCSVQNFTLPVGAGPVDVTVAVKITVCPEAEGFGLEVRVVVVGCPSTT